MKTTRLFWLQLLMLTIDNNFLISYGGYTGSLGIFDISPCSDPLYNEVLMKTSSLEQGVATMLHCASVCGESSECDFAVFRGKYDWCKLISKNNSVSLTPPDFNITESQCSILRRMTKLRCKNGGVLKDDLKCDCPENFGGSECGEFNPFTCGSNSWRAMSDSDISWLVISSARIKVIVNENGRVTTSFDVSFLRQTDSEKNYYMGEVNDGFSLDMASESFLIPLRRAFLIFYYNGDKGLKTLNFDLLGGNTIVKYKTDVNFTFLIRSPVENSRIVYNPGVKGSISDLRNRIIAGGRLFSRGNSRTGVDVTTGNTYFERLQTNFGSSGFNWLKPYYYFSARYSTLGNKRFVRRTYAKTGTYKSLDKRTVNLIWEVDERWTKLSQSVSNPNLFAALKSKAIDNGKQVRLLMNNTVSTDITMLFVTNSDIIVYLAEYLTPFDVSSQLDVNSRVKFCLYSFSGTLSECEMEFQNNVIDGVTNVLYDMPVEWIADSRPWDKIFIVRSDGTSIYGSKDNVICAITAGHDIRVCLKISEKESLCYGSKEIRVSSDNHVLFKSLSFMMPRLKMDGSFDGISESNCNKTVHLLSTKGWVKSTSYTLMETSAINDVIPVTFLTMTWFRQLE